MADEPSLPAFPSRTAQALFGSSARKRVRLGLGDAHASPSPSAARLLSNSSDPAVFSSDDDPALDNYAPGQTSRRRKKRYVGAWFAQHPASGDSAFDGEGDGSGSGSVIDGGAERVRPGGGGPAGPVSPMRRPKKRPFERQYDSGVWMGEVRAAAAGARDDDSMDVCDAADATDAVYDQNADGRQPLMADDDDDDDASTSSQLSLAPPAPVPAPADFPAVAASRRRVFQRVPSMAVDGAEATARALIAECLEAGNEEIALIDRNLTTLSDATVEPLSRLVPIPLVAAGVAFEQREPALKVFLSSNRLSRLPGALFDLAHLTVLSLRGNHLVALPPAVGRLRALRSLNVSLNALRALPAELLPLLRVSGRDGRLTELLAHPNPFYVRGTAGDEDHGNDADTPPRHPLGAPPARVARSPVHYMDSTGATRSAFAMQAVDGRLEVESDPASFPPPAPRVPTLLELALATCYQSPQLAHLPQLLPPDAPPHLARQLERARALRDAGGASCSVCGGCAGGSGSGSGSRSGSETKRRPLVAPMTEWIEWMAFAQGDLLGVAPAAAGPTAQAGATAAETETPAAGTDDVCVQLPFVFRGCSWGCVPR